MAEYLGVDADKTNIIPFNILSPEYMKAYFDVIHHPYEKDGIDFWTNYARNNGWKIKENNSWRNQREQHIHLQKGNMNWYIFHRTGEERWSMMIDVNDIFQKMGL